MAPDPLSLSACEINSSIASLFTSFSSHALYHTMQILLFKLHLRPFCVAIDRIRSDSCAPGPLRIQLTSLSASAAIANSRDDNQSVKIVQNMFRVHVCFDREDTVRRSAWASDR